MYYTVIIIRSPQNSIGNDYGQIYAITELGAIQFGITESGLATKLLVISSCENAAKQVEGDYKQ